MKTKTFYSLVLTLCTLSFNLIAVEIQPPVVDPSTYETKSGYVLSNKWLFSRTEANYTETINMIDEVRGNARGFALKDNQLLFSGRNGGIIKFVRADASTGVVGSPLFLSEDLFAINETTKASANLNNDVRVDDAGNVLVCNLVTGLTETFQVWKVNMTTGEGTLLISQSDWTSVNPVPTAMRLEGFSVKGDVNTNATILAVNTNASLSVYKWVITGGVVSGPTAINVDNTTEGTSLYAKTNLGGRKYGDIQQFDNYFLLDANTTYPVRLNYDGSVVNGFPTTSSSLLDISYSGLYEFQLGDDHFLVANATGISTAPQSSFRIFKYTDANKNFSNIEMLWQFPAKGFGTLTNTAQRGAIDIEIIGDTANIYVYVDANGYAKYQLYKDFTNSSSVLSNNESNISFNIRNNIIHFSESIKIAELYSISGKKLVSVKNINEISVPDSGMYIIRYIDNNNNLSTKKIFIN